MAQDNSIPLRAFQGESPVDNFLGSMYQAQDRGNAQKTQQFNQQRLQRQDERAEASFGQEQSVAKLKEALMRGEAIAQIIGQGRDGDAAGFEMLKQQAAQAGIPAEAMAHLTVADLPRLREESGRTLGQLKTQLMQAQIGSERAQAGAANALAQARSRVGGGGAGPGGGFASRPMAAGAQSKEDEDIEGVGAARTLQAKTSDWINAFEKGGLETGPGSQAMKAFGEATGIGTTNSRQLSLLQSDLEGMRNDSLRLNTGVQTEGDAQREWRSLFTNIMDQDYVVKALKRINTLNKRAEALKIRKINIRRERNGMAPLDPQQIDDGGAPSLGYATDPQAADDYSDVDAILGLK